MLSSSPPLYGCLSGRLSDHLQHQQGGRRSQLPSQLHSTAFALGALAIGLPTGSDPGLEAGSALASTLAYRCAQPGPRSSRSPDALHPLFLMLAHALHSACPPCSPPRTRTRIAHSTTRLAVPTTALAAAKTRRKRGGTGGSDDEVPEGDDGGSSGGDGGDDWFSDGGSWWEDEGGSGGRRTLLQVGWAGSGSACCCCVHGPSSPALLAGCSRRQP